MTSPFARVFEAAGCRTQTELAIFLGIRQSSISDAKKRGRVPAEWLVTMLRLRSINPEWVLTGTGPKHLASFSGDERSLPRPSVVHVCEKDMLRRFSSRELADELVRRARGESPIERDVTFPTPESQYVSPPLGNAGAQ